jgi:uncharacterized protein
MRKASPKLTILTIDGGGIRGVVPLYLLDRLEQELRVRLQDPKLYLSHCFHVLSGTSTGAIITAGLSMPEGEGSQPLYDVHYILRAYLSAGQKIFRASTWESFKSLGGLKSSKYSPAALEKYLDFFFKDRAMSDLLHSNLVVAYDLAARKPFIFSGGAYFEQSPFLVKDALRASTSAPIYFTPASVKDAHGNTHSLIDGGVIANSSTLVLLENLLHSGCIDANTELTWLSLGTGYTKIAFSAEDLDGAFSWLFPLLDIINTGSVNNVVDQTASILRALVPNARFIRISPALKNASNDLDDVSAENLAALQEAGAVYIKEHPEEWETLIQLLMTSYTHNH